MQSMCVWVRECVYVPMRYVHVTVCVCTVLVCSYVCIHACVDTCTSYMRLRVFVCIYVCMHEYRHSASALLFVTLQIMCLSSVM
jgi:hypothetical protein